MKITFFCLIKKNNYIVLFLFDEPKTSKKKKFSFSPEFGSSGTLPGPPGPAQITPMVPRHPPSSLPGRVASVGPMLALALASARHPRKPLATRAADTTAAPSRPRRPFISAQRPSVDP